LRLYEHEAKQAFSHRGLLVPESYGTVRTADEIGGLDAEYPVMVKAMVLSGGRGKAGGVKKAADAEEARAAAEGILGRVVGGYPVESLLIERAVDERAACYVGVTMNPATYNLILLASPMGGVDIEGVARDQPEMVYRREIPANDLELPAEVAQEVASFLARGIEGGAPEAKLADAVTKLYGTFQHYDAKVAEINPLIITTGDEVYAADAKVVIDDNALYRQRKLFRLLGLTEARHDSSELTPDEKRARDAGFPFVDLLPPDTVKDPDKLYVGLVPGGAGYGIFSIDEVANIGERFFDGKVVPVNFMDSGGGPGLKKVAEMFHLLMDKEVVDLIVTSRFGGISSCDVFIRGLIKCLRERRADGRRVLPIHGRMVGTDLPGAKAFLEAAKAETPEDLKDMEITVGNQKIMAEVIREGVAAAFAGRQS
jgi:succinyl-CoA synthetase beta subunit